MFEQHQTKRTFISGSHSYSLSGQMEHSLCPCAGGEARKQGAINNRTIPEITMTSQETGELEASSIQTWFIPKEGK